MKVALLGGSFNPPHVAHVLGAAWVLATRDVDQLWFVPTYDHAFGKKLVSFDLRCEMLRLAVSPLEDDRVKVSRVEEEIGTVSRTIDTLLFLIQAHPDTEFSIVIGADILLETDKWKQFHRLTELAAFHVMGRAGVHIPGRDFDLEMPEVSSTAIRAHLAAGQFEACRDRVPRGVLSFIREHGLYGCSP